MRISVGLKNFGIKLLLLSALLSGAAVVAEAANAAPGKLPSVYVVNTGDGTVSLVDLNQMKELNRYKVGKDPYGIALSKDGNTVVVGVEGEEKLKFFERKDFKQKGELSIGKMFHDHIALSGDGKQFFVAEYGSDALIAVDPVSMKESYRIKELSGPHVTKYGPSEKKNYVTCKKTIGIASVDEENSNNVKFWPLNVNPRSLAFSPDESKLYFASFWVDGIFELDTGSGKISRLIQLEPPADNKAPLEVTYHGVESVGPDTVLTANEGRSYVDAVDLKSGKLLSRFTDTVKPCCLEKIPSSSPNAEVLISSTGDASVELVELQPDGKLKLKGKVKVGAAPKRIAYYWD